MKPKPRVTKITIGRLYNLGSYEHIRYEVTVDVPLGTSAGKTMIALERLMNGLAPESKSYTQDHRTIDRAEKQVAEMADLLRRKGEEEFRQRYGHFEGTSKEYIARCAETAKKERKKRIAWERKAKRARLLLDSLGGVSVRKDAKLEWEPDDFDE